LSTTASTSGGTGRFGGTGTGSGVTGLDLDGVLDAGLLAGISPAALAEEFGTPFYVYDLDLIGRRAEMFLGTALI
jgi:hypothetical protein